MKKPVESSRSGESEALGCSVNLGGRSPCSSSYLREHRRSDCSAGGCPELEAGILLAERGFEESFPLRRLSTAADSRGEMEVKDGEAASLGRLHQSADGWCSSSRVR